MPKKRKSQKMSKFQQELLKEWFDQLNESFRAEILSQMQNEGEIFLIPFLKEKLKHTFKDREYTKGFWYFVALENKNYSKALSLNASFDIFIDHLISFPDALENKGFCRQINNFCQQDECRETLLDKCLKKEFTTQYSKTVLLHIIKSKKLDLKALKKIVSFIIADFNTTKDNSLLEPIFKAIIQVTRLKNTLELYLPYKNHLEAFVLGDLVKAANKEKNGVIVLLEAHKKNEYPKILEEIFSVITKENANRVFRHLLKIEYDQMETVFDVALNFKSCYVAAIAVKLDKPKYLLKAIPFSPVHILEALYKHKGFTIGLDMEWKRFTPIEKLLYLGLLIKNKEDTSHSRKVLTRDVFNEVVNKSINHPRKDEIFTEIYFKFCAWKMFNEAEQVFSRDLDKRLELFKLAIERKDEIAMIYCLKPDEYTAAVHQLKGALRKEFCPGKIVNLFIDNVQLALEQKINIYKSIKDEEERRRVIIEIIIAARKKHVRIVEIQKLLDEPINLNILIESLNNRDGDDELMSAICLRLIKPCTLPGNQTAVLSLYEKINKLKLPTSITICVYIVELYLEDPEAVKRVVELRKQTLDKKTLPVLLQALDVVAPSLFKLGVFNILLQQSKKTLKKLEGISFKDKPSEVMLLASKLEKIAKGKKVRESIHNWLSKYIYQLCKLSLVPSEDATSLLNLVFYKFSKKKILSSVARNKLLKLYIETNNKLPPKKVDALMDYCLEQKFTGPFVGVLFNMFKERKDVAPIKVAQTFKRVRPLLTTYPVKDLTSLLTELSMDDFIDLAATMLKPYKSCCLSTKEICCLCEVAQKKLANGVGRYIFSMDVIFARVCLLFKIKKVPNSVIVKYMPYEAQSYYEISRDKLNSLINYDSRSSGIVIGPTTILYCQEAVINYKKGGNGYGIITPKNIVENIDSLYRTPPSNDERGEEIYNRLIKVTFMLAELMFSEKPTKFTTYRKYFWYWCSIDDELYEETIAKQIITKKLTSAMKKKNKKEFEAILTAFPDEKIDQNHQAILVKSTKNAIEMKSIDFLSYVISKLSNKIEFENVDEAFMIACESKNSKVLELLIKEIALKHPGYTLDAIKLLMENDDSLLGFFIPHIFNKGLLSLTEFNCLIKEYSDNKDVIELLNKNKSKIVNLSNNEKLDNKNGPVTFFHDSSEVQFEPIEESNITLFDSDFKPK